MITCYVLVWFQGRAVEDKLLYVMQCVHGAKNSDLDSSGETDSMHYIVMSYTMPGANA